MCLKYIFLFCVCISACVLAVELHLVGVVNIFLDHNTTLLIPIFLSQPWIVMLRLKRWLLRLKWQLPQRSPGISHQAESVFFYREILAIFTDSGYKVATLTRLLYINNDLSNLHTYLFLSRTGWTWRTFRLHKSYVQVGNETCLEEFKKLNMFFTLKKTLFI